MQIKQTVSAAISTFLITACLLMAMGGAWTVDQRTGYVLFGNQDDSANEPDTVMTVNGMVDRLPLRWRLVVSFLKWETELVEQVW